MKETTVTSKSKEDFDRTVEEMDNIKPVKLAGTLSNIFRVGSTTYGENPWTADEIDKFAVADVIKEYRSVVDSCRFFYRRDPLASIVLNKLSDIAMTDLRIIKEGVPPNQLRVYESLLDELQEFAENCSLEFLISGLVVPEIDYTTVNKLDLTKRGVKSLQSLVLPTAMWLRDPQSIIINSPLVANEPSYFLEIPEELIYFIKREGVYPDGTEDKELYYEILKMYPEFVEAILNNEKKIPLENIDKLYTRRKYLTDSPYPTPYLYPVLESLRHKRNIRRMDYSIASRAISAIMQVKVGDKDFPLVDEDDNQLDTLRYQMRWRDSSQKEVERIFQLFTNHTVEIQWVYPNTDTLLDEGKYASVNSDILFGLGMPRILLTGETSKSQTSDSDVAMISPEKTMKIMRRKILKIIKHIIGTVAIENKFKGVPEIEFAPMNLVSFAEFLKGLSYIYDTGNLSRTQLSAELGKDWNEQVELRAEENKKLESLGVEPFAPVPFSAPPVEENEKNKDKSKENGDKT